MLNILVFVQIPGSPAVEPSWHATCDSRKVTAVKWHFVKGDGAEIRITEVWNDDIIIEKRPWVTRVGHWNQGKPTHVKWHGVQSQSVQLRSIPSNQFYRRPFLWKVPIQPDWWPTPTPLHFSPRVLQICRTFGNQFVDAWLSVHLLRSDFSSTRLWDQVENIFRFFQTISDYGEVLPKKLS